MTLYLRVILAYSIYAPLAAVCVIAYGGVGLLYAVLFGAAISLLCALVNYPMLRYRLRQVEQKGRGGYLYGFSDIGQLLPVIKIGRETEQAARLLQHRTAAPFGLHIWFSTYVPDTVYAEWFLHQRYSGQRYNKRAEWFYLTPVMWFELRLLGLFGA